MHQHQTAILFFSRSARAECQYKILDKQLPYTHNLKLIKQNISAAYTKIVDSGLPFLFLMKIGNQAIVLVKNYQLLHVSVLVLATSI